METRTDDFWLAPTRIGDFWADRSPRGSKSLLGVDQEGADGVVSVLAHLGVVADQEDAARGRVHDVTAELVVCVVGDQAHPRDVGQVKQDKSCAWNKMLGC